MSAYDSSLEIKMGPDSQKYFVILNPIANHLVESYHIKLEPSAGNCMLLGSSRKTHFIVQTQFCHYLSIVALTVFYTNAVVHFNTTCPIWSPWRYKKNNKILRESLRF